MNDGLQGFASGAPPSPLESTVAIVMNPSVVFTEPGADAVIVDALGKPLQLSFSLSYTRTLLIRFGARFGKATTADFATIRGAIYDNAVRIWPTTALTSVNWYGFQSGADGQADISFEAKLVFTAGNHIVDIRHNGVFNLNNTNFGQVFLLVQVLTP